MQIYNHEHRNRDIRSKYGDSVTRYQENLSLNKKFHKIGENQRQTQEYTVFESINESINKETVSGDDKRMVLG